MIDFVIVIGRFKDKGEFDDIGGVSYFVKFVYSVLMIVNVGYYFE